MDVSPNVQQAQTAGYMDVAPAEEVFDDGFGSDQSGEEV